MMLPDFPSVRKQLDEAVMLTMRELERKNFVLGNLVKGVTQHEGRTHSFHQEGRGTVQSEYTAFEVGVEIKFDDVPHLIGAKLQEKLEEISSQMAKKKSDQFYSTMDRITAETGNRITSGPNGPSKHDALEMLRMTAWSPDSVFIAHPDMAAIMHKNWLEWQQDRNFMREYEQLSSQKKEEWRARESNRKLVS